MPEKLSTYGRKFHFMREPTTVSVRRLIEKNLTKEWASIAPNSRTK